MVLSENTSKIGKPEISFTEYKDPDNESVTENNSPWEPCMVNTGCADPEPYTVNVGPLLVPFDEERYARDAVRDVAEIPPKYANDPVPLIPDPDIVNAVTEPDVNEAIAAAGYAPTVTPSAYDC